MITFYKETNFKETPIGRIPREWQVVRVKDLGEVVTGTTPSTLVKDYWNGKYPFVTPTDITNNKYVDKTERGVTEKGLQRGRLIPKESVLVTCIASIGKIALASEPCITNQQINAIVCINEVDPHYVYYVIASRNNILEAWAGRTTNRIVKKSLFEEFPLISPSNKDEQQKIAEVLSTVDETIQKTNEVIAKTERLKKGLMQELLTKGIGHSEFTDTEIGRIPKKWKVVKIGEILSLEYGKGLSEKERVGGRYPVCGSNGVIGYHNQFLVEGPGIVVGRKGTTGAVSWVDSHFWPIDTTYFAKVKRDDLFLKWLFFKLIHVDLKKLTLSDVVPGLKRSQVYPIRIPLPPLPEQQKIASILSAVDKKLEIERNEKAKLERIKQGLMDLLLNGKIRVKVS